MPSIFPSSQRTYITRDVDPSLFYFNLPRLPKDFCFTPLGFCFFHQQLPQERGVSSDDSIVMADAAVPTPVTEWPPYNEVPTGGDAYTQNLNSPYNKVCRDGTPFPVEFCTWKLTLSSHVHRVTSAGSWCAPFSVGKSPRPLGICMPACTVARRR